MTDFDFTVVPPGTDETEDEFDFEIEQPTDQAPEFDFQVEPPTPEPTTVTGKVKKFGTKLSNALGGGLEEALTTEVPQMVGEAMEWIGSKTTQAGGLLSVFGPDLEKAGKTVGDFFERKANEWYGPEGQRHDIDEKGWQQDIYQGAKMLGPSLAPGLAAVKGIKLLRGVNALLKASAAADKAGKAELAARLLTQANRISETALTSASVATAAIFGASQGEQTREQAEQVAKALDVMGLYDDAKKIREKGEGWVAMGTATIEALGEFLGTKYLGKMLRVNEAKVVEMGLGKAVIRYLKTLGVEVGTEMFQNYTEAKLEKESGVRITAQPWEEAKSAINPTIFMVTVTGTAGHVHNKIRGRVAMALDKEDFAEYTKLTQNPLVTEAEVDKWVMEKITDREAKAKSAGDSFKDLKKTAAPVDTSVKTVPAEQMGSGIGDAEVANIKQEAAKEQEVTQQAQVKAKEVEDQLARDKKLEEDLEAATQAQAVVEQERTKAQAIVDEDSRFNQAVSTEDGFYREAATQIQPIELEGTKEQKGVVKHIRELHQALVTEEGRPDRFRALIYKLDAVDESLAMMGKPKLKAIADGLVHRAMERIDLLELVEKRELAIKEEDKQAAKAAAGTATMPEKALPPIPTSGKFDFSNPNDRQSLLALGYTENEIDMAKRFAYMRKPTRQTKEKPVSALRQPGEVPGAISVEKLREIKAKEATQPPQLPQDQRSQETPSPAIPISASKLTDESEVAPGLTLGKVLYQIVDNNQDGVKKSLEAIKATHGVEVLKDWMNDSKVFARAVDKATKGNTKQTRTEVRNSLKPALQKYSELYREMTGQAPRPTKQAPKETIVDRALKLKDGTIISGKKDFGKPSALHAELFERLSPDRQAQVDRDGDGFITNKGRYVDRAQARAEKLEAALVPAKVKPKDQAKAKPKAKPEPKQVQLGLFAKYERSEPVKAHVSVQDIKEGFQKVRINLAKAAPVAILNTSTDLKGVNPELYNQMENEGVHGRIKGVYDPLTNTIYVFADMHQTVIEAKVTTWHEMGHFGLQDLLGDGLTPSVDRVRSKYQKEIQEYMDRYRVPNTVGERRRAAEEILIEKFQANKDLTIVQSLKSLIHGLANRIGFEEVVTDAEVSRLLKDVRENILEGRTENKNNYWLVGHTQGEPGDKVYQLKRGPYASRNAARKAAPQALGMIYSEAVKRGFKIVSMEKIGAEDYKYQREVYPANMHPRHENILHKVREDIASGKIEEGSPEYAALLKKHGAEIRGATIQHAPGVRFLVGAATVYGPKQKGDTKTTVLKHNLYGPVEITSYKDKYGRDVTVGPIFSQDPATRAKEIDEIVSRHQRDITWYEDWKNWMMSFVKAGIPETTITKCIKIQALLSAGSGPRENQRYFTRVINALESGTLRPGPLSRITEQSKTQLGLFLDKGQTKGDIQKETEVAGAGISAQVYPKIMEIWEGRDNYPTTPEKQAAYGEKVGAYLATALAPLEERTPVIDRHMPRPWGFNIMWSPKILQGQGTWKVDPEVRDMITADIQASSARTGVSVGGIQAAIWFEVRNEDISSATYWEAAQEGMEFVPEMFQSVMTLEGQDAIHYSDKVLTTVRGSGLKESHNTYSKKDIGTRKAQTTAEWPYIPLGQFFTATATPGERFVAKVAHLATVQPGTIYDGGMDLLRLWTKAARTHEANHGTNITNIFSKLVRDLGYQGFSHQVQGQNWVAFFGETPVVGPSKTQARVSDVITPDHAVPQDLAQLHEIANERAGLLQDEIEAAFKDRYPDIKVQHSAPTLAHFVDATQNEMEYGLNLELLGPMPSIRAAMSDIIGLGKAQHSVYIQGDSETMGIAPTGVNLRFNIKQGVTTDAVAIGLKKHGVVDYNLELGPKGLVIDQYFDGKDAVPENLAKFFDEYGEPGTAEQYDAALRVLDRNNYNDHILNHFGVTEGEKIYEKSYAKGQVHKVTGGRLPSGVSQEAVQGRNDLPTERGEGEDQPGTQGKYLRIPKWIKGGQPKVKVIPMTIDEVEKVANDIRKHLATFPNLTVVNSIMDVPPDKRKRVASPDTQQYVRGFIENKYSGTAATIWIIANKQQSEASLRTTLFHELLGHWGIQRVYPDKKELNAFLDRIIEAKPRELAYVNSHFNYNFDLTSKAESRRIAEEWFSKQISDTRVLRNIWLNEMYDRLADMFQRFARMMGIKTPITNSEIRVVMKKSADAILKNKERGLIELIGEPWTPELEAKRGTMPKYSREVVTIPGEVPTETDLLVNPSMQTLKDFIREKPTTAIAAEKKLGASPMAAFDTLGWRPIRWMLIASPDGKPNMYAWDGYAATHVMMLRIIRRNWIDVIAWDQAQGDTMIQEAMTTWADESTWRKPRQAMYSRAAFRDNVSNEYPGLLEKIGVPNIGKEKEQATILARKIVERSPWRDYGPYKAQPEVVLSAVRKALMGDISTLEPWEQDAANQFLQEHRIKRGTTLVEPEGFLATMPSVSPDTIGPDVHKKEDAETTKDFDYKYMRHTVPYKSSMQYAKDVAAGLVNVETPELKAARQAWVQREQAEIERVRNENPPPSMRMEFFQENTREEQQLKLAAWQMDLQKKTSAALKELEQEGRPMEAPAIPMESTESETGAAIAKWNEEHTTAKYSRVSYNLPFPVEPKKTGAVAKHFYYHLFSGTHQIMAASVEAAREKIMRTHGISFLPDNTPVWERSLEEKEIFKYVDKPSRPKYARTKREQAMSFAIKERFGGGVPSWETKDVPVIMPGTDRARILAARERADEMHTDQVIQTVMDFRADRKKWLESGKTIEYGDKIPSRQNWTTPRKASILKVWNDFADSGYVSNEKMMDKIWRQVAENAMQVVVNTDLTGEGSAQGFFPRMALNKFYSVADLSYEEIKDLKDWLRQDEVIDRAYDFQGAIRTSDFGLKIGNAEAIFYAQTAEEKLVAVDRIFNTVHTRFDLASLFVEGGWNTLEELAGRSAEQNMSPGELLKRNEQVFPGDLRGLVSSFDVGGGASVKEEGARDRDYKAYWGDKDQEEYDRYTDVDEKLYYEKEKQRIYGLLDKAKTQAERDEILAKEFAADNEKEVRTRPLLESWEDWRKGVEKAARTSPKYLYSEQEIKDHIGLKDVAPGDNNRMGLSLFQKFTTQVFDSNLPRKVLEPKDLPAALSGYKAASMISNLPAVMHAVFHEGAPQFESNWVKVKPDKRGGLYTIFSRLGETADNFFLWQTAKSAQELIDKGRTNIFGQEQATGNQLDDQQMVDSINVLVNPDYTANTQLWDTEEKRLKEINESILDFAEKSNIINHDARLQWQRQNYIPFNRVLDDDLWGTDIEQLFPRNPAAQVGTVFKLKGGKLNMGDPLMNLANTYSYLMQQSLKNLANGKTLNLALGAGLVHRIAPPPSGRVKKGEIQVRVEGEAQFYKVLDPYLYDALIDMDLISGGSGNKYLDWLIHWPKVALTYSVTVAPAFRVANFIRDTLSTSFMENSFLGVSRAARNFVSAMIRTNQFREFASTGGAFTGAYHSRDILANTAEGIENLKADLLHEGFDARNPLDYAKFVLDVWNRIGEASENANRLRVYTKAVAKGKSVFDAAYEAKDLLDFHRTGKCAILRYFTTMVPFLNARLQGLYKMGRTSVDDKTRLNFWLHAVGLTVASLALHAHNRDDDRYKALTDADKLLYWHFFDVPGIGHLKVPNPFEVGVMFAAMPVAIVETMEGTRDGADLMRFIRRALVNVFAFDPTPQFAKPIVGQYFNQNTFTGQQIVPMGEKGIAPEHQYGPSTSATARATGELLGVSPRRIDQLVNDYFSYAGMTAFYFTDMALRPIKGYPEKAGERVGDMNVTGYGRFVKGNDPSSYTKAQEMFYDYLDQVEEARNTWTMLRNTRQMDKAREWKEEHRELINRAGVMGAAQDQVAEINRRIKRIHANPNLTPAEKRLQLNEQAIKKNRIFEKSLEKRRERANDQAE